MTSKGFNFIHPLEIAFCGYSNSGKTTVISKLIERFSSDFHVGYFKHDAHRFEMDHPGKDTFKATAAGAKTVVINSQTKSCLSFEKSIPSRLLASQFIDCDFVLLEGQKKSKVPKIVVLSHESHKRDEMIQMSDAGELGEVLAFIGTDDKLSLSAPYFHRDDVGNLAQFVLDHFQAQVLARPTKALILAGGRSKRMNSDKGALSYHGKSQVSHLYDLIKEFCSEVFVSCRDDQAQASHMDGIPKIFDLIKDKGPMGGIISAMEYDRQANWLVVACDLPFLNQGTLQKLFNDHNPYKVATCFINPEKGWPEPLCTIYSPKARAKLYQYMGMDMNCPRKVLFNSEICALELDDQLALENANTPQAFEQAMKKIEHHSGELI
ncbi:MAG: bifunctional molybdenum cofactor guanylyltransferase MobA/molybdopterin-guanine dinucleotide biosynthesis adaptor protein MobB [Bacteriovoracaceae bacterium]|nr:bifunctional molybdenum cofactor guanylyltransferase MobA/molybdopterin-guanine dinucleotide biosynthesis adaptor protein MobB [Bacteriovoracaceae bacterium]